MLLKSLSLAFRVRRFGLAMVIGIFPFSSAACGTIGIPLKDPAAVSQQASCSTGLRIGESTRDDARTTLGKPLLESDFWGFDLYRASDTSKEIRVLMIALLPIPMGVFTPQMDGYIFIAYDNAGRIAQVSAGNTSNDRDSGDFEVLRARDLSFGIDRYHQRGMMLMADAARLQGYLAARRQSGNCTLIVACDNNTYRKWPFEGCPDRFAVDDAEPFDPRPFFGVCKPGKSCPPDVLNTTGLPQWMPMVHPMTLRPGFHRLTMSSGTFKGRNETGFECAPGEVRYGIIRGSINWHWWGPPSSTLNAAVTIVDEMPAEWASYSMLLYRRDDWIVEPVQFPP